MLSLEYYLDYPGKKSEYMYVLEKNYEFFYLGWFKVEKIDISVIERFIDAK